MAAVEGEIIINRPVDEVFDVVADERNEPRYNPRLLSAELIRGGPTGVGTRFRAEARMLGRPVPMTIEFTAYERPRLLASWTRMAAMDIRGTLTFEAEPAGTRMRWHWSLEPRGISHLLAPLLVLIGRRQEEAVWTGLKRYLEGRAMATPPRQEAGLDRA